MASAGQNLFLRKTLRASGSTTFNAPGNYLPPYGSTVIKIGGRGASGNPNVPGNTVPGNYSGANPGSPGNVSGNNPATLAGHNYGVWTYNAYYVIAYVGPPGLSGNTVYFGGVPSNNAPHGQGAQHTYPGPPSPQVHGPFYVPDYAQHYSQTAYFSPSTFSGSPNFSPGNPNYKPYTPGNPNYNPTTNNPTTPGNAGTSANIEGVTFPGGPIGTAAPVVPSTATSITYTGSNISITVPSGGYVTIENV